MEIEKVIEEISGQLFIFNHEEGCVQGMEEASSGEDANG